jgi:hypothetical protein
MRHAQNAIRVFLDQNSSEALRLYATGLEASLRLGFKVFAKDKRFKAYTEINPPEDDSILYFENRGRKKDATNRFRLHRAKFVAAKDFEKLKSSRISDILSPKDRLLRPEFVVSIGLGEKEIQNSNVQSTPAHNQYYLKFKARETIWQYYVLGSLTKKKPYIVDLNNKVKFTDSGPASLPFNRTALTFRSKQKLPMREKSEYRFQLKEKDPAGGKVLIKRLPVAAANQFATEIIKGKEAIVSEIFINC